MQNHFHCSSQSTSCALCPRCRCCRRQVGYYIPRHGTRYRMKLRLQLLPRRRREPAHERPHAAAQLPLSRWGCTLTAQRRWSAGACCNLPVGEDAGSAFAAAGGGVTRRPASGPRRAASAVGPNVATRPLLLLLLTSCVTAGTLGDRHCVAVGGGPLLAARTSASASATASASAMGARCAAVARRQRLRRAEWQQTAARCESGRRRGGEGRLPAAPTRRGRIIVSVFVPWWRRGDARSPPVCDGGLLAA